MHVQNFLHEFLEIYKTHLKRLQGLPGADKNDCTVGTNVVEEVRSQFEKLQVALSHAKTVMSKWVDGCLKVLETKKARLPLRSAKGAERVFDEGMAILNTLDSLATNMLNFDDLKKYWFVVLLQE